MTTRKNIPVQSSKFENEGINFKFEPKACHSNFKIHSFVLAVLFSMFLASCSSDDDSKDDPEPVAYRRSLIIYMAAQNSLGYEDDEFYSASTIDSMDIYKGVGRTTDTSDNIFLFIDDDRLPRLYRLYRQGGRSQLRTMISKVFTWPDDACSTDPATLHEVLSYVGTNYPSQSYGLVMWSHGSGWQLSNNVQNTLKKTTVRSFGVDVGEGGDMESDTDKDDKMGVQMDIADMATAIARSGIYLDYIFFDACDMQGIEVAYELKDVTSYVIGSATVTSGYGAYYTNFIPEALMASYPISDENAIKIAHSYYYDTVENEKLQKYYDGIGNVNSVIKTSQLENLAAVTGQYISKAIKGRQSPDMSGVQRYSDSEVFYSPDQFDMGSALYRLLGDADYATWRAEADKCIIAHNASSKYMLYINDVQEVYATLDDPDHVVGVSMFVPQDIFDSPSYKKFPFNKQFRSTAWYKAANWVATGW